MRLIDADKLYCTAKDIIGNKAGAKAWAIAAEIRAAKTVGALPVKHGKWEEISEYNGWGDTYYRCSVCGEKWYLKAGTPADNRMNYCPRCGARMDGGGNENEP